MTSNYSSTVDNTTLFGTWNDTITTATTAGSWNNQSISIGINDNTPITPFQERGLDYKIGRDRYSYAEKEDLIKVDKGSPAKARYAVFYAVNKDPVIFCRTRQEMIKEVKKLLKRKEVDPRSIRIFALIGGAKVVSKNKRSMK